MWIKIRIRKPGSSIERVVSAYANSGYEAGQPTVALPLVLASSLGLERMGASWALDVEERPFETYELERVEVRIELEDRPTLWARCRAESSARRREVLMSRELIGLLKIVLDYDANKWRLKDDEPSVMRDEAEPERLPLTGEQKHESVQNE